MADEEIDVLGDISLDNLGIQSCYDNSGLVSQSSELLNCDYTIHPQWLLDNTSANPACWYSNSASELSSNFNDSLLSNEAVICSESNPVDQTGWSKQEKQLLEKGIEIFGKSSVRLSQFIGSKSATEVKYYLKHHYCDIAEETVVVDEEANVVEEIVLEGSEIPSTIEEVISVINTNEPAVQCTDLMEDSEDVKTNYCINTCSSETESSGGRSLLKNNLFKNIQINDIPFKKKQLTKIKTKSKSDNSKVKFRVKTPIKRKTIPSKPYNNKIRVKEKELFDLIEDPEEGKIEIVTGNGFPVPMSCGEEVIKIKKVNSDSESNSDVDIDIEDDEDNSKLFITSCLKEENITISQSTSLVSEIKQENFEYIAPNRPSEPKVIEIKQEPLNPNENALNLQDLSEEVLKALNSLETPAKELILDTNEITELEKYVHSEFFEGRATKTPARYLKIRNHIIGAWISSKPLYVTKTSIRHGLKNCGDVNCIGRIHQLLEQIGAINFGCIQTEYVRPLHNILVPMSNAPQVKEKVSKNVSSFAALNKTEPRSDIARVRTKTPKFLNEGEGGYTLVHDENGDVIKTTVNQENKQNKVRIQRKPSVKLIYCRHFSEALPAPFSVTISFTVLLQMDLHAHSSLQEVMGLVGGIWDSQTRSLNITRYEPCKNIASSATHCDMCPVSQARAAESLNENGVQVLGWFHSHPTFAPEPSQQDLDTQLSLQDWLGHAASWQPFVGIILSPYSLQGALIASPYRCLIVDKSIEEDVDVNDEFIELKNRFGEGMPYKFQVTVNSSKLNVNELLIKAKKIWNFTRSNSNQNDPAVVDFNKPYFLDKSISFMEKFITSVKMHLAKCSDINKMTCDAIIDGFNNICCKSSLRN